MSLFNARTSTTCPPGAISGALIEERVDPFEALLDHGGLLCEGHSMRQAIHREVRSQFVPDSGGSVAAATNVESSNTRVRTSMPTFRRIAWRTASKVFWAVAGEKAFTRAMSQHGVPGALLSGSLAAGTAYVQERTAQRVTSVSAHAISQRSLFSLYTVIGLGVGLGAMLMNRRY